MNIQAEVSLYPLRTSELSEAIDSFLGGLKDTRLTVREGNMSTMLTGDVDEVFSAVGKAFKRVANGRQVVLILKVSNACPSGEPIERRNTDVKQPA
jgi:uncharacterized protein YqgV (UPF0045/DUF77 family)